jgi:ABC-type transport system involved in multi-copper enzyme maturation permease subunit
MPIVLRWFLRLGITNPITVRLVQNGSRRLRHLYIRAGYLAVLILVLLWVMLTVGSQGSLSYRQLAQAGASSFEKVAYLQIGLICVLAPVFMAGAIAQEASPRTWEVLLTTPLSALQIVLGNLAGRLFFILALLFSSLPLFALTQYFGGVPGRSIFASYAIAACAALIVGTIAISLSVSRLVGKRAVFAFYIAVVSYLALTIAVDFFLRGAQEGAGPNKQGVTWMTCINPFLALEALLDPSGYPRAEAGTLHGLKAWAWESPVTTWCVGSILLSVFLVGISTFTVRLGGLGALTGGESAGVPWYRKIFGLGRAGAEHRPPRAVWTNPIAWREAAARNSTLGRIAARWTFIAIGALWAIGLVAWYHSSNPTPGGLKPDNFQLALLATVIGELVVGTLVAINMASTAISREREDGTLDLLTTTPITQSQYLTGKLRGLIAYMLPLLAVPIGTLLLAGTYFLSNALGAGGGKGPVVEVQESISGAVGKVTVPVVLAEAGLVAGLVVVPYIALVVMIGLLQSLKSRGTLSSVTKPVAWVGVLSGSVGFCSWSAGAKLTFLGAALAAASPASRVYAMVHPASALDDAIGSGGLETARVALFVGAAAFAGLYILIIYLLHSYMLKIWDVEVRKLAGGR